MTAMRLVRTLNSDKRCRSDLSAFHRCGILFLLAFISLTAACGHHDVGVAVPKPDEEKPVSFLEDDQTTRSEVISRLGKLAASFEGGRILVFALDKEYNVAPNDNKVRFHLTLVFDEHDEEILKKHSLVRIK
jgi:hypothetical protein